MALLLLHAAKASEIDVSGINRPLLFKELYKNAQSPSRGLRFHLYINRINKSKARECVGKYIDNLYGVKMNICVPSESSGNSMDAKEYDASHGPGTAESVVNRVREKSSKKKSQRRIRCCFGLECDRRGCLQSCANVGIGICICGASTAIGCAVSAAIDASAASTAYNAAEDAQNVAVENIKGILDRNFRETPDGLSGADGNPLINLNAADYSIDSTQASNAGEAILRYDINTKVGDLFYNHKLNLVDAGVPSDKLHVECSGYRSPQISFTNESGNKYILTLEIEPKIGVKYEEGLICNTGDGRDCISYKRISENDFYNGILEKDANENKVEAVKSAFNSSVDGILKYYDSYHGNASILCKNAINTFIHNHLNAKNYPVDGAGDMNNLCGVENDSFRGILHQEIQNWHNIESALVAKDASLVKANATYNDAMVPVYQKTGAAVGAGVVTVTSVAGCATARSALGDSKKATHDR